MFVFDGYQLNTKAGVVTFKYRIERRGEVFSFAEKISFDPTKADCHRVPEAVLTSVLDTVSLILGISYWKLFCPKELKLSPIVLSDEQAKFWNTVYTKGLGEFFYKNKIDFRGLVNFPVESDTPAVLPLVPKTGKTLVLWGGGKDSIVTAELLKKSGTDFVLFSLNDYSIQQETAKIAGKELLVFKREIDSKLLELNKRADVYNGHVPVSVIYSATALLAAVIYGYDEIVISAEESANYGNVEYLGETINHQWSKSEEFEKMFRDYIARYVTPNIMYRSALRRYSELQVTEIFSHYPEYFSSFSSCNKNFTITKGQKERWCGSCPKCAFVFAMISSYLPKDTVVKIFGKNLFNDPKLTTIYRSMLGWENHKPFDCVGTPEETKAAFDMALKSGAYSDDLIMKEYETGRAKK